MSIREEQGEVFVGDLVEVPVESLDQAMNIVNAGLLHRKMASQAMNDTSSRSHTVLHVDVYQTRYKQDSQNQVEYLKGRLVLVDLAGSERVNKTLSKGVRFEEAKHINQSLTALGNVISGLASNPGQSQAKKGRGTSSTARDSSTFVSYRRSKLTRILTNSLSYDSKIVLLATLGPARSSFNESLGTLQFAQRCQDIILRPKMHLETDEEPPGLTLERMNQRMAQLESDHQLHISKLEEELQLRDDHISMLEQQLEKANSLSMRSSDKNQSEEKEKAQKDESSRQEEGRPSYRALQVADMTTFMAKLLQKLTEMSCKLANTFIRESNEL